MKRHRPAARMPRLCLATLVALSLPLLASLSSIRGGKERGGRQCHEVSSSYHASGMEMGTRAAADAWQTSYCAKFVEDTDARSQLLDSISNLTSQLLNVASPSASQLHGLSYFEQVFDCGERSHIHRMVIEPLYSSLRDPVAITCPNASSEGVAGDIMSRSHIIMADHSTPQVKHARSTLYLDMGASTWEDISQSWMVEQYQKRGVNFDRILMWEATARMGTDIMAKVPPELFHAYQYINEPLTADPASPKNPLNVLKKITVPADFVVVKLDIDNTDVEVSLIKQILQDPRISSRIDELYWEPHYNLPFLTNCCWGKQTMPLIEPWNYMHRLRMKGIRSHGWP